MFMTLQLLWLVELTRTCNLTFFCRTLELGDVSNDQIFGEEIVVKDMHTRKALMNKLVRLRIFYLAERRVLPQRLSLSPVRMLSAIYATCFLFALTLWRIV